MLKGQLRLRRENLKSEYCLLVYARPNLRFPQCDTLRSCPSMVGELLRRRQQQRLPLRVIQQWMWLHAVAGSVPLQVATENMLGPGTGIAAACVRWALILRDVRRTLQSFHVGLAWLCDVSRGALLLLAVRRCAREWLAWDIIPAAGRVRTPEAGTTQHTAPIDRTI